MALTTIADMVVDPEVLAQYITENLDKTNRLIQSGLVVRSSVLDGFLSGGGERFAIPSFRPLDEDPTEFEIATDTTEMATVNKIMTNKQIAVKHYQTKTWGSADLHTFFSTGDAMAHASSQVGAAVVANQQTALLYHMSGLLAGVLSDHIVDGSSASFDPDSLIDAETVWEDKAETDNILIVHPKIYAKMKKLDLIEFEHLTEQGQPIVTFLDNRVVVDRMVPVDDVTDPANPVYTTIVAKPGSVLQGDMGVDLVFEREEREGKGAGSTYMVVRNPFSFHVMGTSFTGSYSGATPKSSDMWTPGNYGLVYPSREIGLAAVTSLA